jgi:hypothetical protein
MSETLIILSIWGVIESAILVLAVLTSLYESNRTRRSNTQCPTQ